MPLAGVFIAYFAILFVAINLSGIFTKIQMFSHLLGETS